MKVSLINYSGSPEKMVSFAARLCYSPKDISSIEKTITPESARNFVEGLLEFGHESPIEHTSFTFGVEGVSRALLAQITRHRIASFSVQSQRYVTENNFSFVIPPKIKNNEKAKKIFLDFMESAKKCYCSLMEILVEEEKERLVKNKVEEKVANRMSVKNSAEDARFVLPNACSTKFIVTMNARSLLNFFRLRGCNRAQWEINNLACKMLEIVFKVAPAIFKNAGPACVRGNCSEGKMCCGEMKAVREKFKKLKSIG